jgi:hypothetical protein
MKNELLDPHVRALLSLCDKEGGYLVVAARAKINKDSLYQIVSGVKLLSGKPKGIGPKIRALLTKRYPNWMSGAPLELEPYQAWPFEKVTADQWRALSEREKGTIEGLILSHVRSQISNQQTQQISERRVA